MTNQEFSNEFDILYNNIMSNIAPGLDEYEKSVFLTKAQEEVVMSIYRGNNIFENSFEKNEEARRSISNLVKDYTVTKQSSSGINSALAIYSSIFNLPSDTWFIVYESVDYKDWLVPKCVQAKDVLIVPIRQDDYQKLKDNPFRGLSANRGFRIDIANNSVNIITKYPTNSYYIRYIAKPDPIILSTLSNNLTIDGKSQETPCALNSLIHRPILERAVTLAIASYKSGVQNNQ